MKTTMLSFAALVLIFSTQAHAQDSASCSYQFDPKQTLVFKFQDFKLDGAKIDEVYVMVKVKGEARMVVSESKPVRIAKNLNVEAELKIEDLAKALSVLNAGPAATVEVELRTAGFLGALTRWSEREILSKSINVSELNSHLTHGPCRPEFSGHDLSADGEKAHLDIKLK